MTFPNRVTYCRSTMIWVCVMNQEQLPDMEVYRTVDGVIVWPQLSHCSLVSSQSSSSTVSSSSTTDPNVSPIRPLSSKDINTAMSLKTTTTKMLKTPKTMCLQVRSASPSPKTGEQCFNLLFRSDVHILFVM